MKFNLWSEYQFRVLWYFVAFIFGVALYFGLPKEPNFIMCMVLCAVFFLASCLRRFIWVKLAFFFVFGVTVALLRVHFVDTEFLYKPQWNKDISGRVVEAFSTYEGQIVILDQLKAKIPFVPKRARFSFKNKDTVLRVGDVISFVGHLYGPNVYQAQRFFFQGLSAQGKIIQLTSHVSQHQDRLEDLRLKIIDRLREILSDQQAAIAIPLIVGEQRVVSQELYDVFRKAGIAHVLSVSGFHMVLLAGFIFFVVRGFLALFPYLALRLPTKKIAAVVAFFVTGFYLLISGLQVPAIRSFMMIALVFLGILTDRRVVSLYTLLLVAFCVLLIRPEWVVSVSFQFSFMAVLILVGVFEDVSRILPKGLFFRVIITAIIANIFVTLALAPFVAYHFNQFNPYGVVGNLLTSLLFSLFIMPLLFMGTVLMPFHLETFFIKGAGYMLDKVTYLANMVATWSNSEIVVPSFSGWGLAFIAFGFVVLCVIKRRLRLIGFVFVFVGVLVGLWLTDKPDIVVVDNGKSILIRDQNGDFLVRGKKDSWASKQWLRRNGQDVANLFKGKAVDLNGYHIAFSRTECGDADLAILSRQDSRCAAKDVFVPRWWNGYEIYLKETILIRNENAKNRYRPWGFQFKRKEKKK